MKESLQGQHYNMAAIITMAGRIMKILLEVAGRVYVNLIRIIYLLTLKKKENLKRIFMTICLKKKLEIKRLIPVYRKILS